MPSQLDKVKALFDELGMKHELIDVDVPYTVLWDPKPRSHRKENAKMDPATRFILKLEDSKGYDGFYAEFEFDGDGNFLGYGLWE